MGFEIYYVNCNICFRIGIGRARDRRIRKGWTLDIGHWTRAWGANLGRGHFNRDFLAFVTLSGETVEGQFTSCHHCQHLDLTPVNTKHWSGRSV